MLEQYNKVKPWESAYWTVFDEERKRELDLPEQFDFELFNAIARYLNLQGGDGGGAETDPDTDPEAQQAQGNNAFLEIGITSVLINFEFLVSQKYGFLGCLCKA